MGLKGFMAGGMLRVLQPSFRSPSSRTVFLPYKKTLPVFMALCARAMSSACRRDCCNCTSGTIQKCKFGLRWGRDQERLTVLVSGMSFRSHVILLVLEDQILQSPYWNCCPSLRWAIGAILIWTGEQLRWGEGGADGIFSKLVWISRTVSVGHSHSTLFGLG